MSDALASMQGPVLALRGVGVWVPSGVCLLADVDWRVEAGEHWALLGANGAGKTTLLHLAAAQRHPSSGTVDVLGHRLGRVDMRELRAHIGFVETSSRVPERESARTVVLTGATGTVLPLWAYYDAGTVDHADALLAEIGCAHLADRPIGVCSQGERARIRIARALMPDPPLVLLDEPFNGLDLPSREDLVDTLYRLALSRPSLTTVTVTHHLEELAPSVDHVLLLREGNVVAAGDAAAVLDSAHLSTCFDRPIRVLRVEGRWSARSALVPQPVDLG